MIESLGLWVFENIGKTLLSEGVKHLLPKAIGSKLENLAKENKKDEFINKLEDILSVNENIKNELLKLQKTNTQVNNQTIYNQPQHVHRDFVQLNGGKFIQKNFYSSDAKNYEKYYNKALSEIKQCSCSDAIGYLNRYIEESTDYKDAKLLLIACEIYTQKLTNEKVNNYINYLNSYYDNNHFALLLLGLIHIDYCQPKHKRIDGLETNEILKKLKLLSRNQQYNSIINCIKNSCSNKAKKMLGV